MIPKDKPAKTCTGQRPLTLVTYHTATSTGVLNCTHGFSRSNLTSHIGRTPLRSYHPHRIPAPEVSHKTSMIADGGANPERKIRKKSIGKTVIHAKQHPRKPTSPIQRVATVGNRDMRPVIATNALHMKRSLISANLRQRRVKISPKTRRTLHSRSSPSTLSNLPPRLRRTRRS